jgi:hypothetical protein
MPLLELANVKVILNRTNTHSAEQFTVQITSTETPKCLLARLMKSYLPQRLIWSILFKLCLILTSREVVVGTVDAASVCPHILIQGQTHKLTDAADIRT